MLRSYRKKHSCGFKNQPQTNSCISKILAQSSSCSLTSNISQVLVSLRVQAQDKRPARSHKKLPVCNTKRSYCAYIILRPHCSIYVALLLIMVRQVFCMAISSSSIFSFLVLFARELFSWVASIHKFISFNFWRWPIFYLRWLSSQQNKLQTPQTPFSAFLNRVFYLQYSCVFSAAC